MNTPLIILNADKNNEPSYIVNAKLVPVSEASPEDQANAEEYYRTDSSNIVLEPLDTVIERTEYVHPDNSHISKHNCGIHLQSDEADIAQELFFTKTTMHHDWTSQATNYIEKAKRQDTEEELSDVISCMHAEATSLVHIYGEGNNTSWQFLADELADDMRQAFTDKQ